METELKAPKTTTLTKFTWQGVEGSGYEIHMGVTKVQNGIEPFEISERNGRACEHRDGCLSSNGNIMGTYLHGLFETPAVLQLWLNALNLDHIKTPHTGGLAAKDRQYDLLADHFEQYVDLNAVADLVGL